MSFENSTDHPEALRDSSLLTQNDRTTAFMSIAFNTSLVEYFQRYGASSPAIKYFSTDDNYVNTGTTMVVDHAHKSSQETTNAILVATIHSGIRAYHALFIQDLGSATNWTVDLQIQKLCALATAQRLSSNSVVSLALDFDGFTRTPSSRIQGLWAIVQEFNISLVTTHYLNTSTPVVFSHSSYMSSTDFRTLRQYNQYISTTPEPEIQYGHGHPQVDLIQDQASLGVDTHFTFLVDMVGQARLWLQNLRLRRYNEVIEDLKVPWNNHMSVEQAFYLITRAGGLSLRRLDIGIIAPSTKGDLTIFDSVRPNILEGKLTYPVYVDVKARFLKSARRIRQTWRDNTMKYGPTGVVDTMRGNGTGY
ncbi:hypothetical protein B0J11DRAFT_551243 [Dendryphion nanum]|uniref:Uncharacterized protein n=1 Tax=Dendryphion nanum TaxID=256645 RepID=A0A9P9DPF4_9PLEO|nr:hypothetical protein B0J11DRAFT_551243 [Dendryphion nanum]